MKYRNLILYSLLMMICCFEFGCGGGGLKPVIYLYPTEEVEVTVKLDLKGTLNFIYPDFDPTSGAWHVRAQPDGKLTNIADGKEYPYLFWDGIFEEYPGYDLSKGFVVEGEKTAARCHHRYPSLPG